MQTFASTSAWRKPLKFGLLAALGCVLAAGLGEAWLAATKPPAPPPPPPPPAPPQQSVVLVLDTSGSMIGGPLEEMKKAATAYINRQDFKYIRIAVVNFDNDSYLVLPLSRDRQALVNAVNRLDTNIWTRMDLGLERAMAQLQNEKENRNILLFTDGQPTGGFFFDADTPTRATAAQIRQTNIRLLAIASGDADRNYLEQLTGSPNLVFSASQGNFGEAFKQAEQIITPPKTAQLVESAPTENTNFSRSLLRVAMWTAILGLGLTLPLLVAQKRMMRRAPGIDDAIGVLGGVFIGLMAGIFAQSLFAVAGGIGEGARVIAWAVWGGLLGAGLAAFVPNLRIDRAAPAGAVGGVLGAIGFIGAANVFGDVTGRFVGAAILGFCIGAMIILAEVAFRRAWLRVSYGPGDVYDLNLGVRPLGVGSDGSKARVLANNAAPVAAFYAMTETGRVYIEEPGNGHRFDVPIGDERTYGNVTITVCGELSEVAGPPLTTPPMAAPAMPAPVTPVAVMRGWQLWHPNLPLQIGSDGLWTVGRAESNHLIVSDPAVSSQHARLEARGGMLTVTDIGSTNGSFVNDMQLTPHLAVTLSPNDRLRLGQTEYVVQAIY